jgi:hypothetical protein
MRNIALRLAYDGTISTVFSVSPLNMGQPFKENWKGSGRSFLPKKFQSQPPVEQMLGFMPLAKWSIFGLKPVFPKKRSQWP